MKNLSRKEALEILNDMKVKIKIPKAAVMQNKRNAALDMAIEALKCSETPKSSEQNAETAQADHIAESDRKVSISCGQENDLISREAAIEALARMMPRSYTSDGSHPADEEIFRAQEVFADCIEALEILPSAQPEIIHCGECIYYDPPHVEKEDARYEYSEMPKEAFDVLGTGLVSMEYGINIGGRCCVDYYCKSYSDDKRAYVREDNYCGRAERRTDETD